MERLRLPFFIAAVAALALALAIELGAGFALGDSGGSIPVAQLPDHLAEAYERLDPRQQADLSRLGQSGGPPGLAIRYLALLDGLLLFTVALIGAGLIIPERVHGQLQGLTTLLVALAAIVGGVAMLLFAIGLVLAMVAMLLSSPFGTLAYLARYGAFDRAGAQIALSLIFTLKLVFAAGLVLAHQRFLQNRGLVLLALTSLVGGAAISLLHGVVPRFLVSITDGIAAIVVTALALLWAVVLLVGSALALSRGIRLNRAAS